MNDLDKLRKLFDEWKVPYTLELNKEHKVGPRLELRLEVNWHGDAIVGGYMCFYTLFNFDPETSKFIDIGIWE